MKRNTLNFVLDVLLGVLVMGMVATGLLMRWVLPPGSGERLTVWGLSRHDWGDVHFWVSAGIGAVLLVHLALHWQWACTTTVRLVRRRGELVTAAPRSLWRNLAGVVAIGLLAAGLGSFIAVAAASVEGTGGPGGGRSGHRAVTASEGVPFLQGSMTLSEAAKACGMTEQELCDRLGVTESVSGDERMGRLVRSCGMTMAEAREKLAQGKKNAARREE
ncbi:MAG: DUF4405 domain-containing protein [Phycisphaerae bacterium]